MEAFLALVALVALGALIFVHRRHSEEAASLRSHLDAVEVHNRRLSDEKMKLERELGERTIALAALRREFTDLEEAKRALDADKQRLEEEGAALRAQNGALEADKAALEQRRQVLEQTTAQLEKVRTELQQKLSALEGEHRSLEERVTGFQGEWSRQLTTLEEEIGTLIRQLGEFRKGTALPIPGAAGAPGGERDELDDA